MLCSKPEGVEYADGNGGANNVEMAGRLSVNNSDAYEAACLAGLGIVQAPTNGLLPQLAVGTLVEILPEYRATPLPVTLLYGHRWHVPKRVQSFIDWLEGVLRPNLGGDSSKIPLS